MTMNKMTLVFALALAIVVPAPAEDAAMAPTQDQNRFANELRSQRKEIVKLRYVRAQDIQSLLLPYISHLGRIQGNPNLPNIMTISDAPENVEKILAAIRELDVKPPDVLYTIQLVLGSETEAATDPDLQGDPIIKELRKLLRFKGYTLLDSTLMRTVTNRDALVQFGPKAEFELYLRPDVAGDVKAAAIETQVRLTQTQSKAEKTLLLSSTLNIKSGDRTVVGVSKLDGGDKGLILIISGRVVD